MKLLAKLARKILFFPLTRMIIAILMIVISIGLEGYYLQKLAARFGVDQQPWFAVVSSVIVIATALLVYCGYVRVFERRPITELAVRQAGREFAAGTAIGFGLFTATIACLWILGYYRVEGLGEIPSLSLLFSIGLVPGFVEEIIARGIVFRITEESLGTWLALLISALIFGDVHLLNPGATWFAAICIALEAGILLAATYVVTRRLWMPIGMHFAWNFTQGGIFGAAVSGMQVSGLFRSKLTGPELLSGGAFGAEASIVAVLVCTPMAVYLLWRGARTGGLVRPFWARPKIEAAAASEQDVDVADAQAGPQTERSRSDEEMV
jgi:membrane protease YdiL (CAAX protease family)